MQKHILIHLKRTCTGACIVCVRKEYLRLDPNGSMAPGARQLIETIKKVLHP